MCYGFESFDLCGGRFELQRHGKLVAIQPTPLRLLLALVDRERMLVSRDELMREIWARPDLISDESLNRAIRGVRRALGDSRRSARFVRTVHGIGYRFVHPVEPRDCLAQVPD